MRPLRVLTEGTYTTYISRFQNYYRNFFGEPMPNIDTIAIERLYSLYKEHTNNYTLYFLKYRIYNSSSMPVCHEGAMSPFDVMDAFINVFSENRKLDESFSKYNWCHYIKTTLLNHEYSRLVRTSEKNEYFLEGIKPDADNYRYCKYLIDMEYRNHKKDIVSDFEKLLEKISSKLAISMTDFFKIFKAALDNTYNRTDIYKNSEQYELLSRLEVLSAGFVDDDSLIGPTAELMVKLFITCYKNDGAFCEYTPPASTVRIDEDTYKKYCLLSSFLSSNTDSLIDSSFVGQLILTGAFYLDEKNHRIRKSPEIEIKPPVGAFYSFPYDFWKGGYNSVYTFFKEFLTSLIREQGAYFAREETPPSETFCIPDYFKYLLEPKPKSPISLPESSVDKDKDIIRLLTVSVCLSHLYNIYKHHINTDISRDRHIIGLVKYFPFYHEVSQVLKEFIDVSNDEVITPMLYSKLVEILCENKELTKADYRYSAIDFACRKAVPVFKKYKMYTEIVSLYNNLCDSIIDCYTEHGGDNNNGDCIKFDYALRYKEITEDISSIPNNADGDKEKIASISAKFDKYFEKYINNDTGKDTLTKERSSFISSSDATKILEDKVPLLKQTGINSIHIMDKTGIDKDKFMRPYFVAELDSMLSLFKNHMPIDVQPLLMKILLSGQRIIVPVTHLADNLRLLELCANPFFLSLFRSGHIILSYYADFSGLVDWAINRMNKHDFKWSSMPFLNGEDLGYERDNIADYLSGTKELDTISTEHRNKIKDFKEKLILIDQNTPLAYRALYYQRGETKDKDENPLKSSIDNYFDSFAILPGKLGSLKTAHSKIEQIIANNGYEYIRSNYDNVLDNLTDIPENDKQSLKNLIIDRQNVLLGNRVSKYRIHCAEDSKYIPVYNDTDYKVYDKISLCSPEHTVQWDDIPAIVNEMTAKIEEKNQTVDKLAVSMEAHGLLNYNTHDGLLLVDDTYLQLSSRDEVRLSSTTDNRDENGKANFYTNASKKE